MTRSIYTIILILLVISVGSLFLYNSGLFGPVFSQWMGKDQQNGEFVYKLPKDYANYVNEQLYSGMLSSIDAEEELGGFIYLSALSQGSLETSADSENFYDTFVYDVVNREITELSIQYPVRFLAQNKEGGTHLFVTQPKDSNESLPTLFKKSTGLEPSIVYQEGSIDRRYRIQWSNDSVGYANEVQIWEAVNQSSPDAQPAKIVVGAVSIPNESIFTSGYAPQWSAENDFLIFLREDGIYVSQTILEDEAIVSGPEQKLIDVPYPLDLRAQTAFYPESNTLAVSYVADPQIANSAVELYKLNLNQIEATAELITVIVKENDTLASPIFSPKGRYLSFISSNDNYGQGSLVIYDLLSRAFVETYSYLNILQNYPISTQWVNEVNI